MNPSPSRERRWRRVTAGLPVTLAALVLLAGLVAAVPPLRHQVALSTSRQPVHFVEMFFPDTALSRACLRAEGVQDVRFRLRSHLGRRERVVYQVAVFATGRTTLTWDGVVDLAADSLSDVEQPVTTPPSGRYTVQVTLPGRPELLLLHCDASR